MISKLLGDLYWDELPKLMEEISLRQDHFVMPEHQKFSRYGSDTAVRRSLKEVYGFALRFLSSNSAIDFWQADEALKEKWKRHGRGPLKTAQVSQAIEKALSLDVIFFKDVMTEVAKDLPITSESEHKSLKELLEKIEKEDNLNESYHRLISFRLKLKKRGRS